MVAGDKGRDVEDERPEVVNTAAHPLAIHASVCATAPAGHAMGDVRSADDHGAGRIDINAAAGAVAAIAPACAVAGKSLVVAEDSIRDGCGAACDINAATETVAGAATARAVTAKGLVVRELAAQDFEDTSAPDTAARTETGAGVRGSGGSPAGLVVGQRTAQDREPGEAGGRDEGRGAGVIDPPTEAVAAVPARSPAPPTAWLSASMQAETLRVAPLVLLIPPPHASPPVPPAPP